MSNHVSFVESVYESVKSPLNSVYNTITGNNNLLPDIENKGIEDKDEEIENELRREFNSKLYKDDCMNKIRNQMDILDSV